MSARVTDLLDLKRRIEEAKGPDRELDCLIAVALAGFKTEPPRYEGAGVRYCQPMEDGRYAVPGNAPDMLVRDYTRSIDVALALVERVLPGYRPEFGKWDHGWEASLWEPPEYNIAEGVVAPTPALALILALVNALIAQQEPAHG
jgi:hypothetical protein